MCKHICLLMLAFMCIYRRVSDEHWDPQKQCHSALFSNESVAKSSDWGAPFLGLRWQHLFYLHDLCVQLRTANTNTTCSPSLFSGHIANLLLCLRRVYEQLELNKICWHALKLTEDKDEKVKFHSICITCIICIYMYYNIV